MQQKVLYEELTPQEFRARLADAPIAYLPLGTLEYHGEYLPLGADGLQARGFFEKLAARAGGIVMPMLFLGPDTRKKAKGMDFYGMDFESLNDNASGLLEPRQLAGSAYWLKERVFKVILTSILKQLKRAEFRIVVAHGHGPSTDFFSKYRPHWKKKFGLQTFTCRSEDEHAVLGIQTDHAGANATSLVMAIRPDLVEMKNLPADPATWPTAVKGQDPRTRAGAEEGKRIIELNVERLNDILVKALAGLQD